ncbi:MAG: hypothetical protein H6713_42850 [Myxococcales bacterium]|nr:hypothetical protein [Myxococcales bacterium]
MPTEPTAAGQLCEAPTECYTGVDPGELRGEVLCVSEFQYGYCTHECVIDADCCAAAGECEAELAHVCARPDDAETRRCLLSCHAEDLADGYEDDADGYCGDFMFRGWTCVSSDEGDAVCAP